MTRFEPSRHFVYTGLVALLLGLMSAWVAWQWTPAVVPATLFFVSSGFLFWLSLHPPIELNDRELAIGNRIIPWSAITHIESTGWLTPLVMKLKTENGRWVLLIFAGDLERSGRLKEGICACAPHALLDKQPQRQRQATITVRNGKSEQIVRYPLLTVEDEAEVERLFQRLREIGHLDSIQSSEEK
jgi:hypothetical protein